MATTQPVRAVLPNGREIRPVGRWIRLAPYPFAIALRPDGSEAAIPSIGFPFALNVVSRPGQPDALVRRFADERDAEVKGVETHAGLAYSPDGKLLYVATGDSGKVAMYETTGWKKVGEIALDGTSGNRSYSGTFAATLVASASGRWLYVLDQGNWRVVVVDVERRKIAGSAETGAYPFGMALSPDGRRLYVTNSGLFEYKPIAGAKANDPAGTGLRFAPFGYPSAAAREGTRVERKRVPGLGDENSNRGSSLWTYTVGEEGTLSSAGKLRLGEHIGAGAGGPVGGAGPAGVAADAGSVYVALAHQDSLMKVSADGMHVLGEAALSPFEGARFQDAAWRPLRGVMPSGVAVRDGRAYVAESGINAVAVVETSTMKVIEHVPVGWNPSAVAISPDSKTLYVVNAKGKGTGANGGSAHEAGAPSYIGALEYGSMSAVRLDGPPSSEVLTATVVAANRAAVGDAVKLPRLKHCFLVIRENRTYDEVLGDVPGANGDPALARYGMDGWAEDANHLRHLRVTPNLHAIVAQYASADNFFVDSDVSADGHRWVMGINPTPFFNTAWTSNYGGRRRSSPDAAEPGRRAMFGGADAPMPEDEPQFGSLWEHVAGSGKGILNYGEGLEIEGDAEVEGLMPEGQRLLLNAPVPQPVFEATDRRYPTFNLGIPDQYRAAEFVRDFRRRLAHGTVPGLIVIRLPNDHTAAVRPADGYPYKASYVADNDLALGKIIAFLSRTPIWKDSAVFVTEDDAQGGVDHVDAHRSVLAIASPWVRPGAVIHRHISMGSITRTIDELLGLQPMNLEDALAAAITDVFLPAGGAKHAEPYRVQAADGRIFDPGKARHARPRSKADAAALRDMDDPAEIAPEVEGTARERLHPHDD